MKDKTLSDSIVVRNAYLAVPMELHLWGLGTEKLCGANRGKLRLKALYTEKFAKKYAASKREDDTKRDKL